MKKKILSNVWNFIYSDYWLDVSSYMKTVSCDNTNLSRLFVNEMD